MLLQSRNDNVRVKLAVLNTLNTLIETMGERMLILVNDILPFISDLLDELDPEVIFIYCFIL